MRLGKKIKFNIQENQSLFYYNYIPIEKDGYLINYKNFPFDFVLVYPHGKSKLFTVSEFSTGCRVDADTNKRDAVMSAYCILLAHRIELIQKYIDGNEIINRW
jgi:hypothetical protein